LNYSPITPSFDNTFDTNVRFSQLQTLSRCNFFDWMKPDHGGALQKWQNWWSYYGSRYSERLKREGHTYLEAWQAIAPRGLPCPDYPLLLPEAWSFQLTFGSGDYGSIVKEEVTMSVNPNAATLRRRYQSYSGAPWVSEEWKGLTIAESQSFLASLLYAIDNPWIYVNDSLAVEPRASFNFAGMGSVKGRPKRWSTYYPSVQWSGILDAEGRVLVNDDPYDWHSEDREAERTLDYPVGVAFRVIRDVFPDPTWKPLQSRWEASEP
jgi:hypothetical protein